MPAQAVLIAYEGFDYDATATMPDANADGKPDVSTQNGGIGFTGAWAETASGNHDYVQSGSLSFGALDTSGNSARAIQPQDVTSNLLRTFPLVSATSGSELWFSYLVRRETGNNTALIPAFTVTLEPSAGGGDDVIVGDIDGRNTLVVARGADPSNVGDTGVVTQTGTTYLLVAKISFLPGADTVSLFVNPTPGATAPATPQATKSDFNFTSLDRVRVFASSSLREWSYDEIRVGTTYADVAVPEPSAAGLLLAGLAMGWGRRSRRPR
jgi:hypothetical protein